MVELKRIKAPSDIPAEGSYVLVLYGPSAMDREHPRGRTLMVRDGKRDKMKLDEFTAAIETAKLWRKPNISRPSTVIDEPDVKRTIGQPRPRRKVLYAMEAAPNRRPVSRTACYGTEPRLPKPPLFLSKHL